MKNNKYVLAIFLGLALGVAKHSQAQTVIKGEKAKYTCLTQLGAYLPMAYSSDGRYVGGYPRMSVADNGFVYDTKTESITMYPASIRAISKDGKTLIGSVTKPTGKGSQTYQTSSFYQNGVWTELQKNPNLDTANVPFEFWGVSNYGITSDGSESACFAYEPEYNPKTGKTALIYNLGIWKGAKFEKMKKPHFFPNDAMCGAAPRAMSGDGKVIAGFTSKNFDPFWEQRVPAYWTPDTSYFLGDEDKEDGDFYIAGECGAVSEDGTYVAGFIRKRTESKFSGLIFNTLTKERTIIRPPAGADQLQFFGVTKEGDAVGLLASNNTSMAGPIYYSKDLGVLKLRTYLNALYGLELTEDQLANIYDISSDGRFIYAANSDFNAVIIVLDSVKINSAPEKFVAKQVKNKQDVSFSWALPINNGKKPIGYNVYQDSVLLNAEPITDLFYTQQNVLAGIYNYAVTAVYSDGESKYSALAKLQVIEIGGCYSVKSIGNEVIYNKTADIYWGLPIAKLRQEKSSFSIQAQGEGVQSDERYADRIASGASKTSTSQTKVRYDLADYVNTGSMVASAQIKIGDKYYAGSWRTSGIQIYDEEYNFLDAIHIDQLPSVLSITTVGDRVFVACSTALIYEINLNEASIVGFIPLPTGTKATAVTYIPTLDENRGGFQVSDAFKKTINVNMDGDLLGAGSPITSSMGIAYHNGYVYSLETFEDSECVIRKYNAVDNSYTGESFDVQAMPELQALIKEEGSFLSPVAISGYYLQDSTYCLGLVVEFAYRPYYFLELEISPNPNLKGYQVYKNNKALLTELIKKRNFQDVILEPGDLLDSHSF